jgi:hypothetical protein
VKVRQAALKRLGEKHVKAGVADAHFEVSVPARPWTPSCLAIRLHFDQFIRAWVDASNASD